MTLFMVTVPFQKISPPVQLPKYAKPGDAGLDCYIRLFQHPRIDPDSGQQILDDHPSNTCIIHPMQRVLCKLGFKTAIPEGYYVQVVPRSGLALWNGLTILNTPGTIDAGFRNEWGAIVINLSTAPVTLRVGDKICQIIATRLETLVVEETTTLPDSDRGLGGFGSTGK